MVSDHVDCNTQSDYCRCIVNSALVISMTALSVAFVALLYFGWWRTAGFLEWTITYLGVFWLLSFIGYLE